MFDRAYSSIERAKHLGMCPRWVVIPMLDLPAHLTFENGTSPHYTQAELVAGAHDGTVGTIAARHTGPYPNRNMEPTARKRPFAPAPFIGDQVASQGEDG